MIYKSQRVSLEILWLLLCCKFQIKTYTMDKELKVTKTTDKQIERLLIMDITVLTEYFTKYGIIAIFIIVLLEYMNLPGFPAGIIMPLAGVFAQRGQISFPIVMLISVLAGLCGSMFLYLLGYFGGNIFIKAYVKRFPKQRETIEKYITWLRERGCMGVFLAKLLPAIRTLISIPAGALRLNLTKYVISSVLGIFIWNFVFVGAGYLLGDAVFSYLA